ncbi:hypothetical protein UFOVP724_116 [uncultured Caudovirales phage]|uniref:Uncharacterized protein n=1 Tax=uncultured Caudovirales phage TaxID=2100421 RepID=A0A6J5NN14_9CAUD|nr:hypothetical protein UFOVP724_116 [uncultured Caudovirales phage]
MKYLILILIFMNACSSLQQKPIALQDYKYNACPAKIYKREVDLMLCEKKAEMELKQCKDDKSNWFILLNTLIGGTIGILGKIAYDNK